VSCKCAKRTDQWHGWECTITDGECMYLFPDSKACARDFGEGPDADFGEDIKEVEVEKGEG